MGAEQRQPLSAGIRQGALVHQAKRSREILLARPRQLQQCAHVRQRNPILRKLRHADQATSVAGGQRQQVSDLRPFEHVAQVEHRHASSFQAGGHPGEHRV